MATGSLGPLGVRYIALDSDGNPLPGAKLTTYLAGTATPQPTYSDVGLTTPNANPVVADAGGLFGPIYYSNVSYKLVLTESDGTAVWSQDQVSSVAFGAITTTGVTTSGTSTATRFYTTSGTVDANNNVATTMFALPGSGLFLVTVTYGSAGYQAYAIVMNNGSGTSLLRTDSGTASLAISISGSNVQVTQTSGSNLTGLVWAYTRISA